MPEIHLIGLDESLFEIPEQKSLTDVSASFFKADGSVVRYMIILNRTRRIDSLFVRKDNFPITRTHCRRGNKKIPVIEIPYEDPQVVCNYIRDYMKESSQKLGLYLGKKSYIDELEERLKQDSFQTRMVDLDSM